MGRGAGNALRQAECPARRAGPYDGGTCLDARTVPSADPGRAGGLHRGFFAAHSIGAGWTGAIASTGRAQAASLYNLAYYLGSSVIGWAGGLLFQSWGWDALAAAIMVLACITGAAVAAVHTGSGRLE